MKLLFWIVRTLIRMFPWLSASYRQRIRQRCKCPACGAVKKQQMKFDFAQKVVVLTCVCCSAVWGYEPMVNPQKWLKAPEA